MSTTGNLCRTTYVRTSVFQPKDTAALTSKRANHDYTRTETFGRKREETSLLRDRPDALSLVIGSAHERYDRVSGVRDDSANYACEIP